MRNERKRFERRCKRILKHIARTGELPELDDYEKDCLYHCITEAGYVSGIVAQRMVSGRIVFEISSRRLSLTKSGLDFCWKPIPWEFPLNILLLIVTLVSSVAAIVQAVGAVPSDRVHPDLQQNAGERPFKAYFTSHDTGYYDPVDVQI